MSDEFYEWLRQGIAAGWVSDVVCDTHEGLPQTDDEADQWDEGLDPCIHGIRVWIDGNK